MIMLQVPEEVLSVSKAEFAAEAQSLRVDLINAQYDLKSADFSVVLNITGDDRVGVVELVQLMHEWMDARYMETHVFQAPSDEERERPPFWRYWRVLPPRGRIGVFLGAWGLDAVHDRAIAAIDGDGFAQRIAHIRQFEQSLASDGTLVLKFWVHTPRETMKARLRKAKKDPRSNWQIEAADHDLYEIFGKAMPHVETLLDATHTDFAPWHVLDGREDRPRNLEFGRVLRDALQARLSLMNAAVPSTSLSASPPIAQGPLGPYPDVLANLDLDRSLAEAEYEERLDECQARLASLTRLARARGQSSVLVFEGWDAAGKGGVIRRITQSMAVRDYRVVPVAAPTDEERARHYLWRFWRQLPPAGQMLILDRSWYGRVLVERVEHFARIDEWQRAYGEIVDFEAQLVERGMVVQKFWLHIDPDEQLARFRAREQTPYKKYKLTEEDYRNRERWDDYVAAVNEMVARTSTPEAPWHLIAATDKRHCRIQVLDAVCAALQQSLGAD